MKLIQTLFFSSLFLISLSLSAQTFTKTYGGDWDEHSRIGIQCSNGDYVVAGFTNSYGEGKTDIWLMRLDRRGEEKWRRYLGGEGNDWPNALIETEAGDLVVAGHRQDTESNTVNAWVLKLNKRGRTIWEQTFGGSKTDKANAITETQDGGFAVAGFSQSFSKGKKDLWLLRLDGEGRQLWSKNYGGKATEEAKDILAIADGGFVLAGYTESYGNGRADILVLKVDSIGSREWMRNYGGAGNDVAEAIALNKKGELVIAGWTGSEGQGGLDGTILCLTQEGVYLWQYTYGGTNRDAFKDIVTTRDGNIAVVGTTTSKENGKILWALKLNNWGETLWEKKFTGTKDDYGHSIAATDDDGFFISGATKSFSSGMTDMWLIKTDRFGKARSEDIGFSQTEIFENGDGGIKLIAEDPQANHKPKLYMLTVGVSEYQDKTINLNFAHTDAMSIAAKFGEMQGVLFRDVESRVLVNEEATLVNIKTAISWLERSATQRDMILIFISSHGALDHKGNLYVLPTDFNALNLFATALNIRDLTEGINAVPCKKLVLLDACHSGQSGFDLLEFASVKAPNLDKIVQELIDKEPGLTVMTSSSGKEYSYETISWGHGAFTKAMLEGLDGRADMNHNGVIHLNELDLFVSERVKELTRGQQHPFTPINLFGDIPIFVNKP